MSTSAKFHWKVLVAYRRSKLQAGLRMKRELAAPSLAGAAILAVSITGVPPFGTVMNVGEGIKNSWSTASNEPPVPHAELMSVAKLSETVKIPAEKAALVKAMWARTHEQPGHRPTTAAGAARARARADEKAVQEARG